jgi:hypothetical protein
LQRPSAGNALDKIASGYHHIDGGQTDKDVVLSKCRNAISSLEKADNDSNSGMLNFIMVIVSLIAVIMIHPSMSDLH